MKLKFLSIVEGGRLGCSHEPQHPGTSLVAPPTVPKHDCSEPLCASRHPCEAQLRLPHHYMDQQRLVPSGNLRVEGCLFIYHPTPLRLCPIRDRDMALLISFSRKECHCPLESSESEDPCGLTWHRG